MEYLITTCKKELERIEKQIELEKQHILELALENKVSTDDTPRNILEMLSESPNVDEDDLSYINAKTYIYGRLKGQKMMTKKMLDDLIFENEYTK